MTTLDIKGLCRRDFNLLVENDINITSMIIKDGLYSVRVECEFCISFIEDRIVVMFNRKNQEAYFLHLCNKDFISIEVK